MESSRCLASDFPPGSVSSPPRIPSIAPGILATSIGLFSVGLIEAAVLSANRPVPIQFAVKYAASNFLPGIVWKHIPPNVICEAFKINPHFLTSNLSTQFDAKRMIRTRTVRAFRYILSSYALFSQLYAVVCAKQERHNLRSHTLRTDKECVLRLTTAESSLTDVSTRKHGDHIEAVTSFGRNGWGYFTADGSELFRDADMQVNAKRFVMTASEEGKGMGMGKKKVAVVELDLSAGVEQSDEIESWKHLVRIMKVKAARETDGPIPVVSVALAHGQHVQRALSAADIVLNTHAIVVAEVRDFIDSFPDTPPPPVCIHTQTSTSTTFLSSGLAMHGIQTETKKGVDVELAVEQSDASDKEESSTDSSHCAETVHLVACDSIEEGTSYVEKLMKCGLRDRSRVLIVPHSSTVVGTEVRNSVTSNGFRILWKEIVFDEALQSVRQALRDGKDLVNIQRDLRLRFGPVNAFGPEQFYRTDQLSRMAFT